MDLKDGISLIYEMILHMGMAIIYISEAIILSFVPHRYRAKCIKGEVALITGAASGIGKLTAVKLANLGANVVIWDVNKVGLEDTAQEIRSNGGKCWSYCCDITDRQEVYRTAKAVKIEAGTVTLLINNAGYVYGKTLLDVPDNEIEHTYKVNILSHYWITKEFLKDMMKDNHGHIVTVASVAGLIGTYNCTDYSATKFAAVGYHESLLSELKAHGYDGIHTTVVCPYFINTGMFPGVKPRFMPVLEPEYVAEKLVAGILVNEVNIILPGSVRFILPFKYILPWKLCWSLMYNVARGPQTMMMFKRRDEKCIFKENNNVTGDLSVQ